MFDISSFAQGFALGLGMFVCPGPKDLMIARHALLRHPAADLIAIGALSDALLISLGMAGATAALNRAPAWQTAALGLGVLLLIVHGLLAAWRAASGRVQMPGISDCVPKTARSKGLLAIVMVSFINPVAWLDTLLVIGSVGAALPPETQTSFAMGATTASFIWFTLLVAAARRLGPWMTRPAPWRLLEAGVAMLMVGLALYLAQDLM